MGSSSNETIIQVFGADGRPRRVHECYLCKIYKYEMNKGNKDAYGCYLKHLNYLVKKDGGISIKVGTPNGMAALQNGL